MRIILDANFLVSAVQFKVDIFSELKGNELFTLDKIIEEIEKISEGTGNNAIAAKVALDLTSRKDLKILESRNDVDSSLLFYSKQGYAIATQDAILKDKLKKIGGKVIYIRQKKYVVFE